MAKRSKPLEIKIIFDTSCLYTKSEHYLFNMPVSDLLKKSKAYTSVNISWFIPETVRHERQYRMQQEAAKFLPSLERIELLLGHKLNITPDILNLKINANIEQQLAEFNVKELALDKEKVDWQDITRRSLYRSVPFEAGEEEKGFRDALIAQTCLQLINQSAKNPQTCRIICMVNDVLLTDYINELSNGFKNVQVLPNLEELQALLNILVSEVDEETIKTFQKLASSFFFENSENNQRLFYKEDIKSKITKKYRSELHACPEQGLIRESDGILIHTPKFVSKFNNRINWTSRIEYKAEFYKEVTSNQVVLQQQEALSINSLNQPAPFISNWGSNQNKRFFGLGETNRPTDFSNALETVFGTQPIKEKKLVTKGSTFFDVHWSITISQNKKLTNPKIEEIVFAGHTWDN